MPKFDGSKGLIHYRDWPAHKPKAGLIYLHGYGEHSGLYHRFAHALNANEIRVWAIDAGGHGLSGGERGAPDQESYAADGLALSEIAQASVPGLPLILAGHSMGSVAAALIATRRPELYTGLLLTGAPLEDVDPVVLESLDQVEMSRDQFYREELAADPLLAWVEDAGPPRLDLSAALAEIDQSLPETDLPILLINGEHDPVGTPMVARRMADRCQSARTIEIPDGLHDILNDTSHREVASLIADFALQVSDETKRLSTT
jgi:alpha-beta hydrolase superfamily lysophospholipase